MLSLLALVAFFALAGALDWLSCCWHRARERGQVARGAALAMLLEALGWLPIWFAITTDSPAIAVASVLGSAAGTALGLRRGRR